MEGKEISPERAGLLLDQLKAGSIPVMVVFISESGVEARLYGVYVDSIDADGLVISQSQGTPSASSFISIPIGTTCRFFVGGSSDENLVLKYGDTTLAVRLLSGAKLTLYFTAKPATK
jgi:hypothetical protein